MQINPFIFHEFPYAFNKYIVTPRSTAVHAQSTTLFLDRPYELVGSELAALIGVHDLRFAMMGQGLL